jgi:hypothetical protein
VTGLRIVFDSGVAEFVELGICNPTSNFSLVTVRGVYCLQSDWILPCILSVYWYSFVCYLSRSFKACISDSKLRGELSTPNS